MNMEEHLLTLFINLLANILAGLMLHFILKDTDQKKSININQQYKISVELIIRCLFKKNLSWYTAA